MFFYPVFFSGAFVAGNPRNKCALQPGHSLMDWIRLGASGKDLTGVGAAAGHLTVSCIPSKFEKDKIGVHVAFI